ncbi:hypothetical protein QFC22_005983 [Naganishia vaughanmartiniae]|uniref:Uncharacterized protein n=1 Tax=Naganishia vaughanmartiniae TaxID=1424756 RepID=A0ACC2WR23_9TREE|nr:hypothetical protein QFC22_005983 [Naganishia vaughanmartiniae]
MSPAPATKAPKKVLARNIDEATAPNHDLLVSYASSIPNDRLLPLHDWLREECPTENYTGPKPTYHLKLDWTTGDAPVEVVNRAMERCFGARGSQGWQIWVRGDQLNLLIGDFRKEYLRLKQLEVPEVALLDIWVDVLLDELKRIHALPSPTAVVSAADTSLLHNDTETQSRRPSRSPTRPLGINEAPVPRVLTTERIGKPPSTKVPAKTTYITTKNSSRRTEPSPGSPSPPPMSPDSPVGAALAALYRNSTLQPKTKSSNAPGNHAGRHLDVFDSQPDDVEEQDARRTGEGRADSESDSASASEYDVEEDEQDEDEEDDEGVDGDRRLRAKKVQRVVEISDNDESGTAEQPIFVEHAQGPSRNRRAAKQKKADAQRKETSQARTSFGTSTSRRALPATSSTATTKGKRKASGQGQTSSASKRPRVQQLAKALPNTPVGHSSASVRTPGTSTTAGTMTEGGTDLDTPVPKAADKKASIWDYYVDITDDEHSKNRVMQCKACPKIVKGQGTSNFREHQKFKCTGLTEAVRQGIPGIICDAPSTVRDGRGLDGRHQPQDRARLRTMTNVGSNHVTSIMIR